MINLSWANLQWPSIIIVSTLIAGCAPASNYTVPNALLHTVTEVLGVPTVQRGEAKVSCEVGVGTNVKFEVLTPSDCDAQNANLKAQYVAQQQEEQRKEDEQNRILQMQQAEAQGRAAYEQNRAIEAAKSRGYELIPTVKDLILDGKELAARNAKIQITGLYKKIGDNGALYDSPLDLYSNSDSYMPLLTDDAARPVRESLMNYTCENLGCLLEIGGHMTMCKHLNALMMDYPEVPCLHVEVQIVYRPGD